MKLGVPISSLFELLGGMRANVEAVANSLVQLVVKHVFEPLGTQTPTVEQVPQMAEVVWRLRPLADMAVAAEVAIAMEKAIQRHLGERMDAIFGGLRDRKD